MQRLLLLLVISGFTLCSCFEMMEGIAIKDEYYLPASRTLKVGEAIEIYVSTAQNKPAGISFTAIFTRLGEDAGNWSYDDFTIETLKGTINSTDTHEGFYLTLAENNGLHELHLKLIPKKPYYYRMRVTISSSIEGILHYGGYTKDLEFTVTE